MYTQLQKSGKVRFFEKYRDPLTGTQKTVSVVLDKDTTRTRKQAAAILQDKIRQRVEGSHDDDTTSQELTELSRAYQKLLKTFIYAVYLPGTVQKPSKIDTIKLHFGYKNFLKNFSFTY